MYDERRLTKRPAVCAIEHYMAIKANATSYDLDWRQGLAGRIAHKGQSAIVRDDKSARWAFGMPGRWASQITGVSQSAFALCARPASLQGRSLPTSAEERVGAR